MIEVEDRLRNEAITFHRSLFDHDPEPEIVQRYIDANRICFPDHGEHLCLKMLKTVVENRLDVEAVELVLRHLNRDNILTKKIQILFYQIEVRSAYFHYFFSDQVRDRRAVIFLVIAVLRTFVKWAKGKFLVWRYSLV